MADSTCAPTYQDITRAGMLRKMETPLWRCTLQHHNKTLRFRSTCRREHPALTAWHAGQIFRMSACEHALASAYSRPTGDA